MGLMWFGVFLGILLLIAKLCSFWLLTGGFNQYQIKRWILFGRKQGVRDRIHESTFLLFLVDVAGGWAGAHVLAIGGGSMLAMVALSSYTIMCMSILMSQFARQWLEMKIKSYFKPKETEDKSPLKVYI